jgi:hypothetical protein
MSRESKGLENVFLLWPEAKEILKFQPAVVVKGPYEGSITYTNSVGAPTAVEIRMMIDVMVAGRVVAGLPASDFSRVSRRETSG